MKRLKLRPRTRGESWIPLANYERCMRVSLSQPSTYVSDDHEINSSCVCCPGTPCMNFTEEEMPLQAPTEGEVCPVSAIRLKAEDGLVEFRESCIGCGLCVFRCPVGAIYVKVDGNPQIEARVEGCYTRATKEEYEMYYDRVSFEYGVSVDDIRRFSATVKKRLEVCDQRSFYPLVGKLLTAIGFPTGVTRIGDTNDRMDARVMGDFGAIPVEIKSPTEVEKISVKAIRQALENKVVLLSRFSDLNTDLAVTSLAVGGEKPSSRSDVVELVRDIHSSFGMNIGVLTIDDLNALLWKKTFLDDFDISEVVFLRGVMDEETLQE